jgi:hypothetical protein
VVPTRTSGHLLSSSRHFRRLGNRASTYPAVRISETGSSLAANYALGFVIGMLANTMLRSIKFHLVVCVVNPVDYLKDDFFSFKRIDRPEADKTNGFCC